MTIPLRTLKIASVADRIRGSAGTMDASWSYLSTELSEDLSMLSLYRSWLERCGWRVCSVAVQSARDFGRRRRLFGPCNVLFAITKPIGGASACPVWRAD